MTGIKIFVGLGNPGGEYEHTRHNVGFWFNDLISSNLKLSLDKSIKFNGLYKKIPDLDNIHLLNPTTFMNDSGLSVAKILNFYKLKPEEILVIHDELDLLPGGTDAMCARGASGRDRHVDALDPERRRQAGQHRAAHRARDHVWADLPYTLLAQCVRAGNDIRARGPA